MAHVGLASCADQLLETAKPTHNDYFNRIKTATHRLKRNALKHRSTKQAPTTNRRLFSEQQNSAVVDKIEAEENQGMLMHRTLEAMFVFMPHLFIFSAPHSELAKSNTNIPIFSKATSLGHTLASGSAKEKRRQLGQFRGTMQDALGTPIGIIGDRYPLNRV